MALRKITVEGNVYLYKLINGFEIRKLLQK
ncbi:hypothetical protein SAMN05444387_3772 [Flavobacterium pectinovorum]|uniref:Uncharacterized protein n=1 Tax=Flavobacterium pectinovorum TaxID=29533 RepID=A0ABY1J7E7_9FLAO|nr:hypothetical protein SAMN05444387_3772 [Flavobacterium pectinovorum]